MLNLISLPPPPTPLHVQGNLRSWLLNKSCFDQFSVIFSGGDNVAICENTGKEQRIVTERKVSKMYIPVKLVCYECTHMYLVCVCLACLVCVICVLFIWVVFLSFLRTSNIASVLYTMYVFPCMFNVHVL